jgi:hypothetical protein
MQDEIAAARRQAFAEAVDVVKAVRASWATSPIGKGAMKALDEVMKIERALVALRDNA